ncbi:unnamed protein product [Staurois parvus]|uniref:Uncharacterized protein n=1 Tax=Staurois parvus TaxID=386267 RepID=A0ABN9FS14_9NEOB|nr:unnamed protein product [Staurois parvus]
MPVISISLLTSCHADSSRGELGRCQCLLVHINATYQCPSEQPFSASQCCLSMPISATYQCLLISAA